MGIEPTTFGSCGWSFIKLRHQIKGLLPSVLIYKRDGDLLMYYSKQINKYRYHHENCSNKRSDVGLLLGFPFLYIFDIQNHENHDFNFWPLDGVKDQKFVHHHSRNGLFSRPCKFHHFTMFLSEIRNFQWNIWEVYSYCIRFESWEDPLKQVCAKSSDFTRD